MRKQTSGGLDKNVTTKRRLEHPSPSLPSILIAYKAMGWGRARSAVTLGEVGGIRAHPRGGGCQSTSRRRKASVQEGDSAWGISGREMKKGGTVAKESGLTPGDSLSRAGASPKARSPAQGLSAQEKQEWHPCRGQPRVGVRAAAQ